jgi:hypothetical protein
MEFFGRCSVGEDFIRNKDDIHPFRCGQHPATDPVEMLTVPRFSADMGIKKGKFEEEKDWRYPIYGPAQSRTWLSAYVLDWRSTINGRCMPHATGPLFNMYIVKEIVVFFGR